MKGGKRVSRTVIILGVLALALFIMIQGTAPEPVNWTPSFVGHHRIPYGTAILREQLPTFVPGATVRENTQPAYISASTFPDSATFLIVNGSFNPDEYDTRELLEYAERGGTVMVVANDIDKDFLDTLGLEVAKGFSGRDTIGVSFVNPALGGRTKVYGLLQRTAGSRADNYFSNFDVARSTVLGVNDSSGANVIAVEHGGGRIIVNLLPYAFTNYSMLRHEGFEYVRAFLNYAPADHDLIWDEFYKSGREMITSPLRYVLAQEGLRWALWIALAGLVLGAIFLGRRTQRIIPVVAPPLNATVQFTETIAQLYQRRADHYDLAMKKQTYTLEALRHRYGIGPQVRGEEFVRTLAARAGIDRNQAANMMAAFEMIDRSGEVDASDLLELARTVDKTVGVRDQGVGIREGGKGVRRLRD